MIILYFSVSEMSDRNLEKVLFCVLKQLYFRQGKTLFSVIVKVESVYYFIDQPDWSIKEGVYCKEFLVGFQLPKFCICRYGSRYQVVMQHVCLESWQMSSLPL